MSITTIGFPQPERPAFPSHVQYTGDNKLLSPPEIKQVIDWCEKQKLDSGTIGNGGTSNEVRTDKTYRCVETCAVIGSEFKWLYDRVSQRVLWANEAHYRFHLSGINEPIGYLKYTAPHEGQPEAGHYDWHQDFGGGKFAGRKLSLVIQLSDPSEYAGCELYLCNDGPWVVPYKEAGDAILFPSWTPHCVSNIEQGVRRALVLWVHGPQYQ